ncbi:ATP-binding cassette domain-containing protein [Arthrobacter sp. AQ5-05]|uniref:ATP-binding cassette domain-containing protein n=1 Tax=Arthrobacter sp. AQ5-05 TaxID=2184581 RepID=UPI0012B56BAC|nr:ATP-binding cassette domain-containing protein [Arthrobacter sp. AQ5-05]
MQRAKHRWWLDAAGLATDTPPRGWAVVAATLLRTLFTATAILSLAGAADAILGGQDATRQLLAAAASAVAAAASAGIAAALPAHQQGAEEPRWRNALAAQLLNGPLDHEEPAGRIVGRLGDDVERIASYRSAFLGPFMSAMLVPVLTLALIGFSVGPFAALVLAVCIAAAPALLGYFMSHFRASNASHRRASAELATEYLESVRALGTIAMLGAGTQRRVRLARLTEQVRYEIMRLLRRNLVVLLVTDGVFGLAVTAAAGILALSLLGAGRLTLGTAFALILLARLLLEPVDQLGRSFYVGMAGRVSADRVAAVLKDKAALQDKHDGSAVLSEPASTPLEPSKHPVGISAHGIIVMRGDREAVHGAAFTAAPGTITALVGPSGSGKTSLALCLAGLLSETQGKITFDGAPSAASRRRASVAFVPQHTVLFTGTLATNLRLGAPHATDAQLWAALDRVGLGAELRAEGRDLETAVTGLGAALSGGQAQRLSIARALLGRKPVLVMDEPTANLDPESAALVLQGMAAASATATVLFVTHRLEETAIADVVLRVEAGQISTIAPKKTRQMEPQP